MAKDAYPPELMELMSAAFDAAYDRLQFEPSQALQLQLATRIMAAVSNGERDPERLPAIALGEVQDEPEDAEQTLPPPPEEPASTA